MSWLRIKEVTVNHGWAQVAQTVTNEMNAVSRSVDWSFFSWNTLPFVPSERVMI